MMKVLSVLSIIILSVTGAVSAEIRTPSAKELAPGASKTIVHDAGVDAEGHVLKVVQESQCPAEHKNKDSSHSVDDESPYCTDMYTLKILDRSDGKKEPNVILEKIIDDIVHDGHGSSEVGYDIVTITNNRITHHSAGGGPSRWVTNTTSQLSPYILLEAESIEAQSSEPYDFTDYKINYQTQNSSVAWGSLLCKGKGEPASAGNEKVEGYFQEIIFVDNLPPDVDWKSLDIRECSITPQVKLKGEATTSIRIVALNAGSTLLVDIPKESLLNGSTSWLHDDHLELWMASEPDLTGSCINKEEMKKPAAQWAILPDSVKILPAYGSPKSNPIVARSNLSAVDKTLKGIRLKIDLAESVETKSGSLNRERVSLAWSEGNGKKQESLTATSKIKLGNPLTLGRFRKAACQLEGKKLVVVNTVPDP
jgi:hypothetical protein